MEANKEDHKKDLYFCNLIIYRHNNAPSLEVRKTFHKSQDIKELLEIARHNTLYPTEPIVIKFIPRFNNFLTARASLINIGLLKTKNGKDEYIDF